MNAAQIRKFCRSLGIKVSVDKTKGWITAQCPLASWTHEKRRDDNPSFGIKVKPGRPSQAHCFTCGFAGDIMDLVLELKARAGKDSRMDLKLAGELAEDDEEGGGLELSYAEEDEKQEAQNTIEYFSEHWCNSFPVCTKSESGLSYFESRGVPRWVVDELGIRFDPNEKRVCFPIRDADKNLVGLHGRAIDDKTKPKYRMYTNLYPAKNHKNNPVFWYGEEWVNWEDPVVIVESVFDLTSVYRVYKNVICPLTAEISIKKIERIKDAFSIILILDSDKAGRKAAYKIKSNIYRIKKTMPYTKIIDVKLPPGKDPGDLSAAKISTILKPLLENMLTG